MSRPRRPERFGTIIIGGGITGLALTNALQKGFCVLESRSEIATPENGNVYEMRMCYRNLILLASAASRPIGCLLQERSVDAGHQGQRRLHPLVFVSQKASNLQGEQDFLVHRVRGEYVSPAAP